MKLSLQSNCRCLIKCLTYACHQVVEFFLVLDDWQLGSIGPAMGVGLLKAVGQVAHGLVPDGPLLGPTFWPCTVWI